MSLPHPTDPVLLRRRGERIAHVLLNRPERRNALTGPMAVQLAETVETLNLDERLNVIVLRGAEGAFCSGLDLKEFNAEPRPEWVAGFGAEWQRVHRALYDSPKIVVGALERAAVNGGAALALACDFLIVGEGAFLQVGEVQQGVAAPMNMAWLRLRHAEAVAARVALLGDRIGGAELVRLGIAHDIVDDAEVGSAADALAARLAGHHPDGVRRIKTSLRRGLTTDSASDWFARFMTFDPLRTGDVAPVAAVDR